MIKRSFDVVLAFVSLLALLPVLLVAYLWVRLDSAGPGFFLQERVGMGGRMFKIMKLRTMHAHRLGSLLTIADDGRITGAGHWLRRFRVDELPQLINVIVGDMSFVGPRPEVPRYVALYPVDLREKVLSVRPGLTDPATLKYREEAALLASYPDPEEAYRRVVLPDKIRMYVEYIDGRSFLGDLRLLSRTIRAVVTFDAR